MNGSSGNIRNLRCRDHGRDHGGSDFGILSHLLAIVLFKFISKIFFPVKIAGGGRSAKISKKLSISLRKFPCNLT